MKANLTRREMWTLAIAGALVILILGYLGVDAVLQSYNTLEDKTRVEKEEMKRITRLREQYRQTHSQLQAIREQMEQADKGFSPVSFIEDLATKEQIRGNMGAAKQKTIPLGEDYKEDLVEIELNDIPLQELVNFVHKIENSGHLLRVKRLKIKTRFDNRNLLHVTMQVSTYSKSARKS